MKGLMVIVTYPHMAYDALKSREELIELARACYIEIVSEVSQNIDKIRPSTFIGSGKIEEIKLLLEEDVVVIFDEELSPLQMKNLIDELGVDVIDRSDLILRIFKQRAKTKEAKLQVEIAQYQYLLPRLIGSKAELTGQMGGSNFRGSGEKQLELDRRKIYQQLHLAKSQLAEIVKQRQTQRKRRQQNNVSVVALVGYTNSGKSTLLNALTDNKEKAVLEKDMLFATLETSSRKTKIRNTNCIITDTVGFIHRLPHHLVQAFRSTLEEIKEADVIIHVLDSSAKEFEIELATTKHVLEQLGASDIPTIYAYNKIDKNKYAMITPQKPYVYISAKENINIDTLKEEIATILFTDYAVYEYHIPYSEAKAFTDLQQNTNVDDIIYGDNYIYIRGSGHKKIIARYKHFRVQH